MTTEFSAETAEAWPRWTRSSETKERRRQEARSKAIGEEAAGKTGVDLNAAYCRMLEQQETDRADVNRQAAGFRTFHGHSFTPPGKVMAHIQAVVSQPEAIACNVLTKNLALCIQVPFSRLLVTR